MKRAALSLMLCMAFALPAASPAGAATTTIGQVAPGGTWGACQPCSFLQAQLGPSSPVSTVPAGNWTVTSWSIMSGPTTNGNARLTIWRKEGSLYRLVGQSSDESVIAAPGGAVRTFSTGIPVQGGDLLGLRTGNVAGDVAGNYGTADSMDQTWLAIGDPAVGDTVGPGGTFSGSIANSSRINASAVLSQPDPAPLAPRKKKCKKKHKRAAAAKKKCKKKR